MNFTRLLFYIGLSSFLFILTNCSEEPIQTDLSSAGKSIDTLMITDISGYSYQVSPELSNYFIKTIIKGDQKIKEISAASIIAKVSRDKLMLKMSESFKKYKWDLNAGYGTRDHINAIRKYGVTRFHRKTFNPIHNILSHRKK